jgi:uncharacterized protein (TIGR00106 family)
MLVEFSMIPIGSGSSIGDRVAEVMKIVDSSGLPYKVNPMGTVIEGEWDELFSLIKRCHMTMMEKEERVVTSLAIDDRKGRPARLEQKVQSVEKRIGKILKK